MGDRTYQIERELQTTRTDLSENLGELQDRIKGTFDWRTQVNERPGAMLALAFGGGVLLAALAPRWSRSRDGQTRPSELTNSAPAGETAKAMNALKGAVVGAAISKASDFMEELLPGFKEEFAKARIGT
jgi:hypothetical protein